MSAKPQTENAPVIIKKYANRRLYNTSTSSYVTLENLSQMVRNGGDFIVYDAKNGDDITRSVLTQIIVEEEQKGQNLLPISFLRQLIGFYGNNMQWLVPRYLDFAMKSLARSQEEMGKNVGASFGAMFPFGNLEEMGKSNLALFEKAMKMFSPFGGEGQVGGATSTGGGLSPTSSTTLTPVSPTPSAVEPVNDLSSAMIKELTERMNQLQSQLETITRKGGK